jgi:tetratricopeptide (TPR) repeat protein
MLQILKAYSNHHPVLLIFEDLHRASRPCVDLIELIVRQNPGHVLLLSEFRLAGAPGYLREALENLATSRLESIRLDGFEEEDVRVFLEGDLGGNFKIESWFVEDLLTWSGGTPFNVRLRIDGLKRVGAVVNRHGRWNLVWSREQIRLYTPDDQVTAVEQFLDELSVELRSMLEVASIEGKQFHGPIIANVLDLTVEKTREALRLLERKHGIVRRLWSITAKVDQSRRHQQNIVAYDYEFSHGIFRDAVNAQIQPETRIILATKVANSLITMLGNRCNDMADRMAELLEAGGQLDQAAHYCQLAAENSTRSFDDYAGISHAERGISLLSRMDDSEQRSRTELALKITLGALESATRGFSAPLVQTLYLRTEELSELLNDHQNLFPSIWGLWVFHVVRAEMEIALERAESILSLAEKNRDPWEMSEAYSALGLTKLFQGEFPEAIGALTKGLTAYSRITESPTHLLARLDPKVFCLSMLARASHQTASFAQAIAFAEEAVRHAHVLKQPYSIAFAEMFLAYIHYFRGDINSCLAAATSSADLAVREGLHQVTAWAGVCLHRALGQEDQRRTESITNIKRVIEELQNASGKLCCPQFLSMLAELLILNGDFDDAEKQVENGILLAEITGNRDYLAELLRMKAQILQMKGGSLAPIRRLISRAAQIALSQGARAQLLRILVSSVICELGSKRKGPVRKNLKTLLSQLREDEDSGEMVLAKDVLAAKPDNPIETVRAAWWLRVVLRG